MWTKFGQMTGKVISKLKPRKGLRARPKSLKTMENIANKSKPIVNKIKGYKNKAIGAYKKTYKKYPTATPLATAAGIGLATYPLMKDTEIVQSRVRMRKEAEKVRKEIKAGKKISFKERYKRLSEAGKMRGFP